MVSNLFILFVLKQAINMFVDSLAVGETIGLILFRWAFKVNLLKLIKN